MNNDPMDGLNAKIQDLNVLKNTDIGVLRKQRDTDRSTYTRTTKPDGTVVEKIKMRKSNKNNGLVDVKTDGVEMGKDAVNIGISKEVSEDVVGFVDSIWGSKQVASQTAERRMYESQKEVEQPAQTPEEQELETLKKMREEILKNQSLKNIEEVGKTL